ncbi:MAG: hypothetical protein QNK32_03310 [Porticoccus sp.]|nr:hypothetical protein [Porticoccus sp.]
MTGEKFGAQQTVTLGLIDEAAEDSQLNNHMTQLITALKKQPCRYAGTQTVNTGY